MPEEAFYHFQIFLHFACEYCSKRICLRVLTLLCRKRLSFGKDNNLQLIADLAIFNGKYSDPAKFAFNALLCFICVFEEFVALLGTHGY